MSKNYYYLVSGLPELKLDTIGKTSSTIFEQEVLDKINPEDKLLFDQLRIGLDHQFIVNTLAGEQGLIHENGIYSENFLKEEIISPEHLPLYLKEYLKFCEEELKSPSKLELAYHLELFFYQFTQKSSNPFLKWWFDFNGSLKNILIWKLSGSNQDDVLKQIIPFNELSKSLRSKNFKEAELANSIDWYAELIQSISKEDILEKEKAIDQLRWEQIDQQNQFAYFSTQVLLGYYIKLKIVERWAKLDPVFGKELLQKMISDSKSQIALTQEN